jgi:CubicO group peptidase (beta-lactamase class C family)/putative intracellular protease/amidase
MSKIIKAIVFLLIIWILVACSSSEQVAEEVLKAKALLIIGNEFGNTYFDMKKAMEKQGFYVDTAGVDSGPLLNSCPNHTNIEVTPDFTLSHMSDADLLEYGAVFIPSGKHHRTIGSSSDLEHVLNLCKDEGIFISSVCAGNIVLSEIEGLIEEHKIASSSFTSDSIKAGNGIAVYDDVVVDGVFITGDQGGGKEGGGNAAAPIEKMAEIIKNKMIDQGFTFAAYPENTARLEPDQYAEIEEALNSLDDLSNMLFLSVVEDDSVIQERFYHSYARGQKNNVFSVTKSITSMLVGMAIEEGLIESTEQTISDYLDTDYYELTDQHKDITIGHLLTMTMGLEWNTNNLGLEYSYLKARSEPLHGILDRDFVYEPGEAFLYSDGAAHTMSIVFTVATGKSLFEYAQDKLFQPLGIEDVKWNEDRQNNSYGGFDLFLSHEDLVKIGVMVKDAGIYEGQEIVPAKWLAESTEQKISTGSTQNFNNGYGYYWWLGTIDDVELIAAVGHGGQFIYIVPEYDLVITAGATGAVPNDIGYKSFQDIQSVIVHEIIPVYLGK